MANRWLDVAGRMRLMAVAVLALTVLALTDEAGAQAVDLMQYFPNPGRAATHDLLANATGERLTFRFPTGFTPEGAFWGRSVVAADGSACGTDWQYWTPAGLYYVGWLWACGQAAVHWTTPPSLALPREADPSTGWSSSYSTVVVTLPYDSSGRPLPAQASVALDEISVTVAADVLPGGEPAILMSGRGASGQERWWVVDCIPLVPGPGCDRGIRRVQMLDGTGRVTADWVFGAWVERLSVEAPRSADKEPFGLVWLATWPSAPAPN